MNVLEHQAIVIAVGFEKCVVAKLLIAMDFDHTIIDQDAMSFMKCMVPDHMVPITTKESFQATLSWIPSMQSFYNVVNHLHISEANIRKLISDIPPIAGMDKLLSILHKCEHDIIIISNSNQVMVDQWLESKSLKNTITKIFTNPSWFDENEKLNIEYYQNQTSCKTSPCNLCKRQVLESFVMCQIGRGMNYEGIAYVGDGKNDLCAVQWMDFDDVAMPRLGYKLDECLNGTIYKAQRLPWTTGEDVLRNLVKSFPFSFRQCDILEVY